MRRSSLLQPASRASGVTLLEMALGMMIVAIVSVGISNLVRAGVESQMAERTHQNMQLVANNIVDDIRFDIRQSVYAYTNSSDTALKLDMPASGSQPAFTVVYRLSGNQFSRQDPRYPNPKNYNDPSDPNNPLSVQCLDDSGNVVVRCFEKNFQNSAGHARQIRLPALQVTKTRSSNTIIDQYFGAPNYTIRDFAFDVMGATEFQ